MACSRRNAVVQSTFGGFARGEHDCFQVAEPVLLGYPLLGLAQEFVSAGSLVHN